MIVNTVHSTESSKGLPLGVKERQGREREAVARAILDAARSLFVAEGYQNVSIRKIADLIEYSPAAIYSYFPSKDDIFFALAEEGFRILGAQLDDPPVGDSDLIAAVRRPFWCLYTFSRTHPEYFALMFVDRSVPRISRDWERFGFVRDMKAHIADVIQRAIEGGVFARGTDPHAVFGILSAAVVGPAVMQLCNRMAPGDDAEALARDTLEAALTGLRTGFPLSFKPGPCSEGAVNE
jgi:AcrR family transcriptional regulator